VPLLESTTLGLRATDVVFLHRHRVRLATVENAIEGGAKVANARCGCIGRIVRKYIEESASQDLFAHRHGGAEVGIADRHDGHVRQEYETQAGGGLKEDPEVDVLFFSFYRPHTRVSLLSGRQSHAYRRVTVEGTYAVIVNGSADRAASGGRCPGDSSPPTCSASDGEVEVRPATAHSVASCSRRTEVTARSVGSEERFPARRHPINGYRLYDRAKVLAMRKKIFGKVE
jgi:hypothetical protein